MRVSKSLNNLINGVSEQSPLIRLESQCEHQENCVNSPVDGMYKRPPTQHLKSLGVNLAEDVYIHEIQYSETETYFLVISRTDGLKIYDNEGNEKSVTGTSSMFNGRENNLYEGYPHSSRYSSATIADYTFIADRTALVQKGFYTNYELSNDVTHGLYSLIYVRKGDYSTKYSVTITEQDGGSHTMEYRTPDNSQPSNRDQIGTTNIATQLATLINQKQIFDVTATAVGSVVVLTWLSLDRGLDATVEITDDVGGQNMVLFHHEVDDVDALPKLKGYEVTLKVRGNAEDESDDYWIANKKSTDSGSYFWEEIGNPRQKGEILANSMPSILIKLNGNSSTPDFLLCDGDGNTTTWGVSGGQYTIHPKWAERAAGDNDTNPFPSFVGNRINDIFLYKNRLGFLSGENVCFSETGEFFNFFAPTVQTELDTNPIDVATSNDQVSILRHAVPFNESLLIFAKNAQFIIDSDGPISNSTVNVKTSTYYNNNSECIPLNLGRLVYYATNNNDSSSVYEMYTDENGADAQDITAHVPTLIKGPIKRLIASQEENMLFAIPENGDGLYVYNYYWAGREKQQGAWNYWPITGVVDAIVEGTQLYLFRRDYGVNLFEKISLSKFNSDSFEDLNGNLVHLDSIVEITPNSGRDYDEWIGQFVAIDGRGRIYNTLSDVDMNNYENIKPVYTGSKYNMIYSISEQYPKDAQGNSITTERLTLNNLTLNLKETGELNIRVSSQGRDDTVLDYEPRIVGALNNLLNNLVVADNNYRFFVMRQAKGTEIVISSDAPTPVLIESIEWQGDYQPKTTRI